jgi:hypothetical protein
MRKENLIHWYKESLKKDLIELESSKKRLVTEIKNINKKEIFPEQKKLTIWQKIKKILNF